MRNVPFFFTLLNIYKIIYSCVDLLVSPDDVHFYVQLIKSVTNIAHIPKPCH